MNLMKLIPIDPDWIPTDHIWISIDESEDNVESSIIEFQIADHYPTLCRINIQNQFTESLNIAREVSFKVFNKKKYTNFKNALSNETWPNVYSSVDVDVAFENFILRLDFLYHQCFPTKNKTINDTIENVSRNPPWMTPALLSQIKFKNSLWKRTILYPNNEALGEQYKTMKKRIRHLVSEAKISYYNSHLEFFKSNMKQYWRNF